MDAFYSDNITNALKNDPPGEWMPYIPEDCIRLSSGFPAPSLVPVKQLKESIGQLLDVEQDLPLHYLGTPKMDELKQQIIERLDQREMKFTMDEVLVTAGACQAIDLIARIFVDEETVVAVESPTYMEALEIYKNYTDRFIEIPMDEDGLQTERFAKLLADRKSKGLPLPQLLYTIPTFQNPTGTTLTEERRRHLLELADTYDFLIIEDDAYGELFFHDQPKTLKAWDKANRVLYVGSFSKVIAPGLRIGWVSATKEIIEKLFWFKKDLDHPFAQAVMSNYLRQYPLNKRLSLIQESYKEKCSLMKDALADYMPDSVSWYVPRGGYFVWVKLPGEDTSELLEQATKKGVSFLPGKHFFLDERDGREWLRLSFSYEDSTAIVEGVKKLSEVVCNR
ncbi:PLP-dependent aminotransferase family protein [Gracilibacillus kekensis]|uniref:2-aminoadipate transaminase n=1 Tax=Gracilibacillus kekensis TaxID=1027249 RepID=A0A1M7L660_9BACI|nr:PLP-dependent aminotransferase family protein [Gracilibacillus kekensis]SHM73284.1 2-aminoadipate transaminase [Gracilibacillus kekensis]